MTSASKTALRVLVAEDESTAALCLRASLQKLGHELVGLVDNEADLISTAGAAHPDLLILDFHLRVGTGAAAAIAVQSVRQVPCIFMTSVPDEVVAVFPGATMLTKPALPTNLAQAIAKAMSDDAGSARK